MSPSPVGGVRTKELLPTVDPVCSGTAPVLEVALERDGSRVTVSVTGELDLATAPYLRERLRPLAGENREPLRVVVDASGLSFVDVTGLDVFLETAAAVRRAGGTLRIAHPSRMLQRIVTLLGLEAVLGCADGPEPD